MARMPRAILVLLLACISAAAVQAESRVFSSRYYQVHTDLEPGVAQDLARRLDVMHEEYSRRLMRFDSRQARIVDAYLFTNQDDYLRFTGIAMRSTGGVFIPARNAIAAFHDGQGRDNLRRTLQHEAFHQFAANTIRYPLPVWLNEGMAQYFEEGLWTGEGFSLGQVPPRRVRQLQADIRAGRLVDFQKIMSMNPDEWAQALVKRSTTEGATQYNQAWAMVHFLVNSTDDSGQPRFRARLLQMLQLIHEGASPEQAFAQSFSSNLDGFRDRFLEWAQTLEPTVEATYIERQDTLADMMVALHEHGRNFLTIQQVQKFAQEARLRIEYSKGQIRWSSGDDVDVYFARMDGSAFDGNELYLQPRRSAPLPDLVCKCLPNTILRTRFYRTGKKIQHELLFESATAGAMLASPLRK